VSTVLLRLYRLMAVAFGSRCGQARVGDDQNQDERSGQR